MAVKLTKNEQKKQKDMLKQYQRYLPTLQLKKQQLQSVIRQIEQDIERCKREQEEKIGSLQSWISVFGEHSSFDSRHSLSGLVKVKSVKTGTGNIAGVAIPVFEDLEFTESPYDLYEYPLWVDRGIEALKDCSKYDAMINTLEKQKELIGAELRTTSQRVNLFEKVKIPEAKENIRKIGIYLGDQQTSAVVRGKIAKKKLVREA